jgi:hypothetical protein
MKWNSTQEALNFLLTSAPLDRKNYATAAYNTIVTALNKAGEVDTEEVDRLKTLVDNRNTEIANLTLQVSDLEGQLATASKPKTRTKRSKKTDEPAS